MSQVPINVIRTLHREQSEIPRSQARDEMALPRGYCYSTEKPKSVTQLELISAYGLEDSSRLVRNPLQTDAIHFMLKKRRLTTPNYSPKSQYLRMVQVTKEMSNKK